MPAAEDLGMVQRRRPALQTLQIMPRIEDLLVPAIRARMRGNHLAAQHHVDAFDVGFDRHGLKRGTTRHAIAVVVEAHRLILVRLGGLPDARIERRLRQFQGLHAFASEALADGLGLPLLDAITIAQTAITQMDVQLAQVAHLRHRRGPIALQVPHPAFDTRLLLRSTHHAEMRRESIVADQGLVMLVQPPLPAHEQLCSHGLGIVPPQFTRHTTIKRKSFDQAVQNRLGPLTG